MTLFKDDFEEDFLNWTAKGISGAGDSIEAVSNIKHHGSFSARSIASGAGVYANVYKSFLSAQNAVYLRCLAYLNALPNNLNYHHFMALSNDTEWNARLGVDVSGVNNRLAVYIHGGATYFGNITITARTWHEYQLYMRRDAVDGVVMGWFDDSLIINQSGIDTGSFDSNECVIGNTLSSEANTLYVDCVVADTKKIGLELVNQPIIYPTVVVEEARKLPSTSSAPVTFCGGTRVRTIRHATPISPWVTQ